MEESTLKDVLKFCDDKTKSNFDLNTAYESVILLTSALVQCPSNSLKKALKLNYMLIGVRDISICNYGVEGIIWEKKLLQLLADYNFCILISDLKTDKRYSVKIFGTIENVKFVKEMFELITVYVRQLCRVAYTRWKNKLIEVMERTTEKRFITENWGEMASTDVVPSRYKWFIKYLDGFNNNIEKRLKGLKRKTPTMLKHYPEIMDNHVRSVNKYLDRYYN